MGAHEDRDELKNRLRNGTGPERADAAMKLGILGAPEFEEELISALKDEDEMVRSNAALALGHLKSESVIKPLLESLTDVSWVVRHDVLIALGQIGYSVGSDVIIPLLKDDVPEVRSQAVTALGMIGGEKALKAILVYMRDSGPSMEVVMALERMGTEDTAEPLAKLYNEGDPDIREVSIRALGRLHGKEIPVILIIALGDVSWRVREEAARALGSSGCIKALPRLYRRLKDENMYVIEKAVKSIGKLGDESDIDRIIILLEHEESMVRAAAVSALGEIGGEKAQDILISQLFLERNPVVVWAMADAIAQAARDTDTKAIVNAMSSCPEEYSCVLAVALSNAGDPCAVDQLVRCMVHESWKHRQKSVESVANISVGELGDVRTERLMNALFKSLSDPDRWVRASAATVLVNLGCSGMDEYRERIREALWDRSTRETDDDVLAALKG